LYCGGKPRTLRPFQADFQPGFFRGFSAKPRKTLTISTLGAVSSTAPGPRRAGSVCRLLLINARVFRPRAHPPWRCSLPARVLRRVFSAPGSVFDAEVLAHMFGDHTEDEAEEPAVIVRGRLADRSYNELCSLKGGSSDVSAPRRASICISVSVLVLWASGSICARRRAFSVLKRSFSALKIATFSAAIRACARASSRSYSRIRARSRQRRAAAVSAASFTALLRTGRNPRGSGDLLHALAGEREEVVAVRGRRDGAAVARR